MKTNFYQSIGTTNILPFLHWLFNDLVRKQIFLYQSSLEISTNIITKNVLLVFSVTPFKIDQNQNQNHLTDKVQNLGNERR